MKKLNILFFMAAIAVSLVACNSGSMRRNPGKAYAMDMTYSRAYDGYTANPNFSDSLTSRLPVQGTVARGHSLPDHLVEGDTNAYKSFTTSVKFTDDELREGGRLYNIYCGICHGTNLDGNGPLYADGNGKYAAAPANFLLDKYLHMPVGQMYAAVKYGKNAMGSYASQVDIKQRWQIIAYIKQKQAANNGDAFTMGLTSSKTDTAKTANTAETPASEAQTQAILESKK
jgi:hypothetical protein